MLFADEWMYDVYVFVCICVCACVFVWANSIDER